MFCHDLSISRCSVGAAVFSVPDVSTRGWSHYCKSALLFNHHLLLYETLAQWEMSGKNRYEHRELRDEDTWRRSTEQQFYSKVVVVSLICL